MIERHLYKKKTQRSPAAVRLHEKPDLPSVGALSIQKKKLQGYLNESQDIKINMRIIITIIMIMIIIIIVTIYRYNRCRSIKNCDHFLFKGASL